MSKDDETLLEEETASPANRKRYVDVQLSRQPRTFSLLFVLDRCSISAVYRGCARQNIFPPNKAL